MPCILQIKQTINDSIDAKLPYRYTSMYKGLAKEIATSLNNLWGSKVAEAVQASELGGYNVYIYPIEPLAEKIFKQQEKIEKELGNSLDFFNEDSEGIKDTTESLDFYNNDRALMEQEGIEVIYDSEEIEESALYPDGYSDTSINDDIAEYNKLVEQANGEQPKTFMFGNRRWILNKFNNYDWSDPITNQIYMRNVNLDTGISEAEPELDKPVDPELIKNNLDYINSNRILLTLDYQFAELGYDLEDLIEKLVKVKTMREYNKLQEIFNKLC